MSDPQQGVFGKMKSGLFSLGGNVQSLVGGHLSTATNLLTNTMSDLDLGFEEGPENYRELWEPNEVVAACRQCALNFVPPVRTKHHCRYCAGVFCMDCLMTLDIDASSVTRQAALVCDTKDAQIKICGGCARGECPGQTIKDKILLALQEAEKKKVKRPNNLAAAREKAALTAKTTSLGTAYHETAAREELKKQQALQPRAKTSIEKLATSIGDKLGILGAENVNSAPIELQRGAIFVGGKSGADAPLAGYFELCNKSSEMIAVKLLVRGGNSVFEIPRPSYQAVPPGGIVSAEFSEAQEQMELMVLFANPNAISSSMVFDTRAKGFTGADISVDRISPCAQVGKFAECRMWKINARASNALLKCKTGGFVECRRGDSVGRIGLIAKLAGKRWVKGEIDYNTNISSVNELKF